MVHYWSRDLLSYARKVTRGRPNDGRGVGGPRSLRTLIRREAACAAGGEAAPSLSAAARHATVAAYLADLPPLPFDEAPTAANGGVRGLEGDERVPAALGRTDGAKGAELGRRLLAGQTLAADTMCAKGVATMCIPPKERGKFPWPWVRWLEDPSLRVQDALWKHI